MTDKIKKARRAAEVPPALPARFSLNPDALDGMSLATLRMPYAQQIWTFEGWLERYFEQNPPPRNDEDGLEIHRKAPYRLLNFALTACAPTIVHGFEWYFNSERDRGRRMLAVGRAIFDENGNRTGSTLAYPSVEDIATAMRLWLAEWAERPWLKRLIDFDAAEPWQQLREAMTQRPDTDWIVEDSPKSLLDRMDGITFDAIPSLVATLLHETESFIGPNRTRVVWRRMKDRDKRYCVVSQPLPVEFLKRDLRTGAVKNKLGFFSYKVEFELQTQAGRIEPWLYLSLHCLRYANQPLAYNKRGSDVTVLVAANGARLENWATDSTLVRLKASSNTHIKVRDQAIWLDGLPSLLARLEARALVKPGDLYSNPQAYWDTNSAPISRDEYYIVHTEGYSYQTEGGGSSSHPLPTGFSLMERAEVLGSLCDGVLRDVVRPDISLATDELRIENELPPILKSISDLTPNVQLMPPAKAAKLGISDEKRSLMRQDEEAELRRLAQPIVSEGLRRAVRGKRLVIALFYNEAHTCELLMTALRDSFVLNEGDALPANVLFDYRFVNDRSLVQPFKEEGNRRRTDKEVFQWRDDMLDRWQKLLTDTFGDALSDPNSICAAIVELDRSSHTERKVLKTTPDRRSAHAVVREACARLNILSQMLVTPDPLTGNTKRDGASRGKASLTIQEIVTRQVGAQFGLSNELGRTVGLDRFESGVSENLDIVALSFCATITGVRYCLATRLSCDGTVDVLLPEPNSIWLPYFEAGPRLGRLFATARKEVVQGRIRDTQRFRNGAPSQVQLTQSQINGFVERLVSQKFERPTILVLEAEKWRSSRDNGGGWWQLQNPPFVEFSDRLVFGWRSRPEEHRIFYRKPTDGTRNTSVDNLLCVIRLRSNEMPQYITNRRDWTFDDITLMRNYFDLTGFVDRTVSSPFHYYSVGRLPAGAGQPQRRKTRPDTFKIVSGKNSGGGVAYRHPGIIEMLPFFVHPNFDCEEGRKALCRMPHFLRSSPAWAMGNLDSPYPLHLGDVLIDDHLCVLGLGDD